MDLTPDQKGLLTRIYNFSKVLIFKDRKILFNDRIYVRSNNNEWDRILSEDPYSQIGFVSYDKHLNEIKVLRDKVEFLEKKVKNLEELENRNHGKKNKYRSINNYQKVEGRIRKVMNDVNRMMQLSSEKNAELEDKLTKSIKWIEDGDQRKKELKVLYEASKAKTSNNNKRSISKVYSNYKRLGVWMSLYEKKYPREDNQYSQFYLDIKDVAILSYTDATKFVKKIGFFTKFFNLLPAGSWAVSEIPVTYWLLIYQDVWEMIFECIEQKKQFPYETYFSEEVIAGTFNKLSLTEGEESGSNEEDSGEEGFGEEDSGEVE